MNEVITSNRNRLMCTDEAVQYIGMGRNRGRDFLDEIGATVKIGKRVLFDRRVIDTYFDALAAEKAAGNEYI